MIKERGFKRKINPRSIRAGRQGHEINKKIRRIKGKIRMYVLLNDKYEKHYLDLV